jgi:dihydrofolate reductase
MYSIIAAMTKNRVIGLNNTLPWKQKNDLQRFKALTYDKQIIMGRKTFESFGSKPLPNRFHTILTRKTGQELQDLNHLLPMNVVYRTDKILPFYLNKVDESFIIGGEQIYALAMEHVSKIYLTVLDCEIEGDAFFPEIDMNIWKVIATESYSKDEFNEYDYKYITYVRK